MGAILTLAVKAAGIDDAETVEIVANVARNIFTNDLNIAADTEIDFPVASVAPVAPVAAADVRRHTSAQAAAS